MTTLKETLKQAKIRAMKERDRARLNPLNLVLAEVQILEIDRHRDATDEEVQHIIEKGIRVRRDTARLYLDRGLEEKAAPEIFEASYLETFLPRIATDEDYENAVKVAMLTEHADSLRDMGAVIRAARRLLAGSSFDGRRLSDLVRERLAG